MKKSLDKSLVLSSRGREVSPFDEKSAKAAAAFCRLFELARVLRSEQGCPWDRKQTPLSMRSALIEEAFEAVDAIGEFDSGQNAFHAEEELGDLFFNATLICSIFEEYKEGGKAGFAIEDALDGVCAKLIRRHPHVFGAEGKIEAESVPALWDSIKENTEGRRGECTLDTVPPDFPPLLKACKFQRKAARKGFDWPDADSALAKVEEELCEVKEALLEGERAHLEEECGDLLFALADYVRKLGVDPVLALSSANRKFYERFSFVEKKCREEGLSMEEAGLEKLDSFWKEAKKEKY